jgi:23S rRNA pseudouridine955/2504/2580 synthase
MPSHPFTHCPILHEDKALLVVDKPSGVLSHPNPDGQGVSAFLGEYDPAERWFQSPKGPLWLIHRLDEDTSGVLLAAKTAQAAAHCRESFEEDRVRKHYLAVLSGLGLAAKGAWLDHLATQSGGGRVRTVVKPGGKPNAELHFIRRSHHPEHRLMLVEIDLFTGKTHQIRVQAAKRRHPVVGDDVYGNFALNRRLKAAFGLSRLFLHARTLEIMHPTNGKRLRLATALPTELLPLLDLPGWQPG